jgi:hypothetical protein
MPVMFNERPVSATWNGRIYSGTYCEREGRLFVSSAYGSTSVLVGRAKAGLKEASRDVLIDIVRNRGR